MRTPFSSKPGWISRGWLTGALLVAACATASVRAQTSSSTETSPSAPVSAIPSTITAPVVPGSESGLVQAGCSSCGGGASGGALCGPGAPGSGGCGSCCIPGRNYCCSDCSECDTKIGKFFCGFYHCICCPDPCYEACWLPVADQGFFLDAARPITQMRLRYDQSWNFTNPDRAEYLFARERTNPNQKAPGNAGPAAGNIIGKGPNYFSSSVNIQQLSLYTEAAVGAFGASVEMPYLHLDPDTSALFPNPPATPASGFGDLIIGTKSMIVDCQLMQTTIGFKIWVPTGNFTKGLGTGHVSLEPSLLGNLCCSKDTYLQSQFAFWIPIAGDPVYQSEVFHMHFSLNHVLCRPCAGVQVVGNIEASEYTVCNGAYTSAGVVTPGAAPVPIATGGGDSFFGAGPGIRMFVCDKIDVGAGTMFALTSQHFADQQLRVDFRWRY